MKTGFKWGNLVMSTGQEDTLFENGSTGAVVENWLEMHRTADHRSVAEEDAVWETSEPTQSKTKTSKGTQKQNKRLVQKK